MNTLNDLKAVTLTGKRWFQKLYGNTYHRTYIELIYNNGDREQLKSDKDYGYGRQWDQTALEMLVKRFNLEIPCYPETTTKKWPYGSSYLQDNTSAAVFTNEIDVTRERDL